MRSYTGAMSTNRPTPAAQITAIAATLALIVITFAIALAAFAAGAYPHRDAEEPAETQTSTMRAAEEGRKDAGPSSAGLLDPSIGRGADSRVCATSPKSSRCMSEGGSVVSRTRGGDALRPATDGPETLLDSEWAERGPADMPGRAPGRGGWVGEEGPSAA